MKLNGIQCYYLDKKVEKTITDNFQLVLIRHLFML